MEYKKGVRQYKKFKRKIKRKKAKLGHLWDIAIWGNIKADKATNKNPEEMEIRNDFPEYQRKTEKIIIQNSKEETVTNSLTGFLKEKREKKYTKELKKLPRRGATLRDTNTCQYTSNEYMKDRS